MKKALVVLLILAVAGGAFAQLNFTGEVKTGLGLVYDNVDKTAYLQAFSRDAEQPFQFRLHGVYANQGDTAGLKFRLQQRIGTPSIDYAYGYLNAFSNMLTLQGGRVDDATFGSGGGILDADSDEGVGTNLLVRPIDNLVIGGGAYVADSLAAIPATYARLDLAKYTAGLSFTLPDTVKVVASFRTRNAISTSTTTTHTHPIANPGASNETEIGDYSSTTTPNMVGNQFIAGVNILALSDLGLKLVLEGRFTNLGDDNKVAPMNVDGFVTVGYTADPLSLGLNIALYKAAVNKPSGSTISDDPIIAFWLYGSYAVTESIIPRLDAVFMLNSYDDVYGSDTQGKWHYKNFTKAAGTPGNKDQKLIAFRPAVLLKMDANNSFEIGDYVGIYFDKAKSFNGKDTAIGNVFYIDYVFKF